MVKSQQTAIQDTGKHWIRLYKKPWNSRRIGKRGNIRYGVYYIYPRVY